MMVYRKIVFIFPLHPKIDLFFKIYKVERLQRQADGIFVFFIILILSIFLENGKTKIYIYYICWSRPKHKSLSL